MDWYRALLTASIILFSGKCDSQSITFSHESGFYATPITLQISCEGCDDIRYTLFGSKPTPLSHQYRNAIVIGEEGLTDRRLSMLPTTAIPNVQVDKGETYHHWTKPKSYKTATIITAVGFLKGKEVTPVKSAIYFIGEDFDNRSLPVMSLIMDPRDLFDHETGIYVPGTNVKPGNTIYTGNYHMSGPEWEKPAQLQYFSPEGAQLLDQQVGIRIHGLKSGSAPQKSLRIYARKKYGKPAIKNRFFNTVEINKFKRLLLRTPFSGHRSNLIADPLIHTVTGKLNLDVMASQPVIVFLNGEYWGFYQLRERMDEYYLSAHYNIPPNEVEIVKLQGNKDLDWLMDSISRTDPRDPAVLPWLETKLNIDHFIDYTIAEIYFRNGDWPRNNETWWRPKGGKWRLLLIDLDAGFQFEREDMFEHLDQYDGHFATLYQFLVQNEPFMQRFVQRLEYLVNNELSPQSLIHHIDSFQTIYEPHIKEQVARWNHPSSLFKWHKALDELRQFANDRPEFIKEHVKKHFGAGLSLTAPKAFYLSTDMRLALKLLGALLLPGFGVWYIRKRKRAKQP